MVPAGQCFRLRVPWPYSQLVAGQSLKILTYNVYNHHEGDHAFATRQHALMETIAEVEPDVVCLQEAPSTAFLRSLVAYLSKRQERHLRLACTEMRRADGWNEHLAVIHPGTARAATVHTSPSGESVGVSVLVAAGPGLRVASVHLNPHDAELRRAQAARLSQELGEGGATVLAGDFNATPGGKTLAALSETLCHLAPDGRVASTYPTAMKTGPEGAPGGVLDHLFGRGVTLEEWGLCGNAPVDGRWPSDHAGVWARVRLDA